MKKTYYQRIKELPIDNEAKDGYCWFICNLDFIKQETKKCKTIGEFRNKSMQLIGFAPALLFSFKHLLKDEETFVKTLEEHFKGRTNVKKNYKLTN